ncbi:MAG: hypothetical protein JXB62_09100 [Pirellulales bacterium]|nr:hypothetical protein [Pirellulales bacterium]
MYHLAGLEKLKELSLKGTPIDGSGLRWLNDLPRPEILDLSTTHVKPGSLSWLHSMRSWHKVDLTEVWELHAGHREALRKAMPWRQEVGFGY